MPALFAIALFCGAFLLFWVEPLVGRMLLPLLGGSPGVWNTCLGFFQALVLAGYLFAHQLGRVRSARVQAGIFLALVLGAALATPALFTLEAPPPDAEPSRWLLARLTVMIGLPFFALAATSPLLQRWFAAAVPGRDAYLLSIASNAGSLAGLLAFPFALEPRLALASQREAWHGGFVLWGLVVVACAAAFVRRGARGAEESAPAPAIALGRRLRWLAWSAIPSALLVGVTNWISTDISAVPLLWVVPLALYLVTFIVAFGSSNRHLGLWSRVLLVLVASLFVLAAADARKPVVALAAVHLVTFFVVARTLHGALAADRPEHANLTRFYGWMALGGAVGGLAASLVAPLVFPVVAEYPLALVLALVVAPGAREAARRDVLVPVAIGAALLAGWWLGRVIDVPVWARAAGGLVAGVVLLVRWSARPLHFGLAVGPLAIAVLVGNAYAGQQLVERSFFGVSRVGTSADGRWRDLHHGAIVHGAQALAPGVDERLTPTLYFSRPGPVGDAFRAAQDRSDALRVGVVGLGAGALASYARAGDRFTFFEIDPVVVRIARDPGHFTFLSEARGAVDVVLGDARLTLARSADRFDLLVLDAFSSDAVPVHLLTREAVRDVYLAHLAPRGTLVLHLSNRFLTLERLAAATANDLGLAWRLRVDRVENVDRTRIASTWIALARDAADLGALASDPAWQVPVEPLARVWTDDASNVLDVLEAGP